MDAALLSTQFMEHIELLNERTAQALATTSFNALVIHSGTPVLRSEFDDQYWSLRLVPHFQHWASLDWPDCAIHVQTGRAPELLFVRNRDFWERQREPDWDFLGAGLQLIEMSSVAAMRDHVLASGRDRVAMIGASEARAAEWGMAPANCNAPRLLPILEELRVFKTPYEVACIDEANRIAAHGHRKVRDAFLAGERSELRLHLLFLEATQQDDPETPYKNIVAIGEAASILHHVHYRRGPVTRGSLLVDAGSTFMGYASDITRTYCTSDDGDAISLFAELIERMESLQQSLVRGVKVGRPYESLHDEAHERLAGVLVESGLAKMSVEECVSTGVSRMFLPHGLGHSLGLQTHDVGCAKIAPRVENKFLRNTRVIEANQVFTVEPGLYFIDTFMEELRDGPHGSRIDWRKIDALLPFGGIRIEDDIVVLPDSTHTATKNLTREALS